MEKWSGKKIELWDSDDEETGSKKSKKKRVREIDLSRSLEVFDEIVVIILDLGGPKFLISITFSVKKTKKNKQITRNRPRKRPLYFLRFLLLIFTILQRIRGVPMPQHPPKSTKHR